MLESIFRVLIIRLNFKKLLGAESFDHFSHLSHDLKNNESYLSSEFVRLLSQFILLVIELKMNHFAEKISLIVKRLENLAGDVLRFLVVGPVGRIVRVYSLL